MNSESAQQIAKESKSSFYYAFNLLPPDKRDAMNTIYAFCRKTDDIVDSEEGNDELKYQTLIKWHLQLEKAFSNNSEFSLLNKVANTIKQFNIPYELFFELIRGMEMDLVNKRYKNFDELKLYCYRVASTVGLMCIEIFGYQNKSARDFAESLGIALQLTNILRDVKKDSELGRIYLPQEDLIKFGYEENSLFNAEYNLNFVSLMEFQANRAKYFFDLATNSLDLEDKSSMFAARAMQHIYSRILERIMQNNYDVFNKDVNLTKMEKVGISLGVWAKYRLVY
ncbi:MAG: squalene synthase HpnD [Chlorobiaceae bacterium]|nr:squalene synthase HpnD [Chlorobiaceae bacterium]